VSPFAFVFRLEFEDGSPAEPERFHTAVPSWKAGDEIPLPKTGNLRVVATRLEEGSDGGDPVATLIVERVERA
jgi:hypothetical protein